MKILKNIHNLYWTLVAFFLFVPFSFVSAQGTVGGPQTGGSVGGPPSTGGGAIFQNPLGVSTLQEFFAKFLEILIQVAFPFIVLAVIYTGFLFVRAQGNPEELKTAKTAFMWTVIGALVILAASAISLLIQGTVEQIIR